MGKRIIVVDDSRTVRHQLSAVLTGAGYEVIEAADGVEGAEKIAATGSLAMVICDVNMPRMNGIDMLRLVKSDPRHADLPVLMLTTEGQPGPIAQAKQAGAKGWIVKPFDADILISAVVKLAGSADSLK
jgi:two-component system, chemotaxis family, chemotaxis protein CheY